jgi:hypothetical protein
VFFRQTPLTSIKNLSLESNWPYNQTASSQLEAKSIAQSFKIPLPASGKLPLGVKLFRFPQEQGPPVLSHHFAQKEERNVDLALNKLDSIKESDHEDTLFGVTPKVSSAERNFKGIGMQSPLSRFAFTPSKQVGHPMSFKQYTLKVPE